MQQLGKDMPRIASDVRDGFSDQDYARYLSSPLTSLRKRLRAALALQRSQDQGGCLDPWQARKVRCIAALQAAVRKRSQGSTPPGLNDLGDPAVEDSDGEASSLALAALIQDGQRNSVRWKRRWMMRTYGFLRQDPRPQDYIFLREFVRGAVAGDDAEWIGAHADVLHDVGVALLVALGHLGELHRQPRGRSVPALARSPSDSEGDERSGRATSADPHLPRVATNAALNGQTEAVFDAVHGCYFGSRRIGRESRDAAPSQR